MNKVGIYFLVFWVLFLIFILLFICFVLSKSVATLLPISVWAVLDRKIIFIINVDRRQPCYIALQVSLSVTFIRFTSFRTMCVEIFSINETVCRPWDASEEQISAIGFRGSRIMKLSLIQIQFCARNEKRIEPKG